MSIANRHLHGLPAEQWDRLEELARRFEQAWQQGPRPVLEEFLPPDGEERLAGLVELVHIDLEYRLKAGEPARVEDYLSPRFPELAEEPQLVLGLVTAEYELRRRTEPNLVPEDYVCRFPQYHNELAAWLATQLETIPDQGRDQSQDEAHRASPITLAIPGYQFLEELGRGGMGVVLRARDLTLGRHLAVKLLLGQAGDHPELEQRFLEEAQVMGQLQHPGVPAVHQLGRLADGRPFFSMKLVRGQTLAELLAQRRSAGDELPRFLDIFGQVCQTLGYAHSRGILHRDLKPANIMVGAFGEVQVMDWGLAKVLTRPGTGSEAAQPISTIFTVRTSASGLESQPGMVAGTLAYMAPEQARGEVDSLDERADVFGLGALLCEVLTGQPPYRGSPETVRWQATHADLEDALTRLQANGADAELLALARDCLAKERESRPRDAGGVADRLTAYQRGVQERLRQAELAQVRAVEDRKRRRVQMGLAVTVLLLLLAGVSGAWLFQQQRHKADSAAEQAMARSRLLLEQATAAQQLDLARFQQALDEAHKAEQLAVTGGASDAVKQQTAALARYIDSEKESARRDQRLLAALLEVRGPREGPKFVTDERGLLMQLPEPSAEEQFASAFRTWGVDADQPVETVLAQLKDRPRTVLVEVIAALDEWASERRQQGLPAARWRHLTDVAQALDTPDSKRRELRDILARGRLPRERALGMLAVLLRPVPIPFDVGLGQDRGRLRQLAAEMDAAREPVLGLLTLARALRVAGEEAQAEHLLRKALRSRSKEVVLYHLLAQLLESQTPPRWGQALECHVALRALRPDLGEPLAYALIQVGRVAEGLALYQDLATDIPSNPWVHSRRGYALGIQHRDREAEAAYRQAIGLKPDDPTAHNNLGNALHSQGRFKEAEAACRQAIRLNPDYHLAHINLGNALHSQGRFKEAEAAYRQAIRLNPDYPDARLNLGLALHSQSLYMEAEQEHRQAIRLKPDYSEAHNNLGNALAGQGRFKEAEEVYRQAIRLKSDYSETHSNLGNALAGQRRFEEAEAAYRQAIRLKPNDPETHNNLGNALSNQGRFKEAEAAYRQAIQLKPDDPETHSNLGNALSSQGRFKEAEAAYRQAIRLKPNDPETHSNLGNALSSQDRFKEAEAAYRQAIQLKPDYPEAHINLGLTLHGQDRFKEAEATYRQAIRLKPDYPKAHFNLGGALRDQGRFAESLEALRQGHALGSKLPGWRYPSDLWVGEAERLIDLDAKLPAVLAGDAKPASTAERLEFASLCRNPSKRLHAAAARFAADAFAAEPKLADNLAVPFRYNAACSAALAAAGEAEDARKLTDKEKANLRQQALKWLRADLTLYARLAQGDDPKARQTVRARLLSWQNDADFTSVRGQEALDKLTEAERDAWRKLWADVAALLGTAAGAPK